MKKILTFILMLLPVLVGCNKIDKVWLFSFGQTKTDVEKTLKDNNYRYQNDKYGDGFVGSQVVEYMGAKWEYFMLGFEDGKLKKCSFLKTSGEILTEEETEKVVAQMDERFGEHREDRTGVREFNTVGWDWDKGRVHAELMRLFGGTISMLVFSQKDNNDEVHKVESHKQ